MKFASRQKAEYFDVRAGSFSGCLRLTIGLVVVSTVASTLRPSSRLGYAAGATDTPSAPTTAWRDSRFQMDVSQVVGRSDVILLRPGRMHQESMPLGNGRLGIGVWSQDGYTAQINREDTLPKRLSPGQIVLPGLNKLASAADYHGRLDLYN